MPSQMKLAKDQPLVIQRFSEELKKIIDKVGASLRPYFKDSLEGELGEKHKEIVLKLRH